MVLAVVLAVAPFQHGDGACSGFAPAQRSGARSGLVLAVVIAVAYKNLSQTNKAI